MESDAILSTTEMETHRVYRFEGFTLDLETMRLRRDGQDVALEPKSFYLLEFLILHRDRVVSKEEIFRAIWKDVVVTDNALTRAITQIRKALNDDPRNPRFIETVPTVGYRFTAALEPASAQSPAGQPPESPAPAERSTRQPVSKAVRVALLAVSICAVIAASGGWWLAHSARSLDIHAMAVLPLTNVSGDPKQDYFAEGTTDELVTQLARIPNLRIADLNSTRQDGPTQKPLRQIAAELHVDAIVEGSVLRSGDNVRINTRLIDVRNNKHLWANSFEGNAANILALEDEVAAEIASHAKLALTNDPASPQRGNGQLNPAAHDAYLRGLYYYDRRDPIKSAEAFQAAVEADPNYALAYAGLAKALLNKGFGHGSINEMAAKCTEYAQKALALDPNLAEGYAALGLLDVTYTWDWASADRNLHKALGLNPNSTATIVAYAMYLDNMNRPEEAVEQMRHAVELEPLSFFMARHFGSTLYFARRYDEALQQLQHAGEMQPELPDVVDNWLTWIYDKKGMHDESVSSDLRFEAQYYPESAIGQLRSIYQQQGWRAYWRARLGYVHDPQRGGCAYYETSTIYTRLGERDRAFADLEKAVQGRCFWITQLAIDPLYDGIRDDPRYKALMREVNLTPDVVRQ